MRKYVLVVSTLAVAGFVLWSAFDKKMAATLIFCFAAWLYGWFFAHQTVATECEKLGRFYVGKNVYECTKIESSKVNQNGKNDES
ncbi:hypothetical protein ACWA5Z_06610 [Testudinibacter sp. P80/BLE/0925]